MKKTLRFLISILLYYIVVFGLAKVGFMLYNHASDTFGAADVAQVWWAGLAMDASTAGYLLILPWLVALIAVWWPKLAVRRVLRPYFIIVGFLLTLILAADIVLYEYWQYKLDASVQNTLQAIGAATPALLASIFRQGIIFIPAVFIMKAIIGVDGLIWAQPVADVLSLAIVIIMLSRKISKTDFSTPEVVEANE